MKILSKSGFSYFYPPNYGNQGETKCAGITYMYNYFSLDTFRFQGSGERLGKM